MLVDEQALAGDPANGAGGAPATNWHPGFGNTPYPCSAYIDLGQVYDLTEIYLYDTSGIADMTISAGNPGNWTPLFTDDLHQYLMWSGHNVNVQTRYVHV